MADGMLEGQYAKFVVKVTAKEWLHEDDVALLGDTVDVMFDQLKVALEATFPVKVEV